MNEREITLPISHLSHSALQQLVRNPLVFKMKYILGVYDSKQGVAGMIGKAGHEALKVYYGGDSEIELPKDHAGRMAVARQRGLAFLDETPDIYIKYGKTGSRELMIKKFNQAMDFYFTEEPEYNEILLVEEKLDAEIFTTDNEQLPMPITGIPDLVHKRKDGKIEIIDTKFVSSFTNYEDEDGQPHEDYSKILQAMFMYHLIKYSKGWDADRVLFREIKISQNMDKNRRPTGEPQIRDYAIPLDHEPYKIIFYNIFKDCVKFLSQPNQIYLPNFGDMFDGDHAGLIYSQGLINSDMSDVEVMHKVRDVAFVSKKFLPSSLDSAENKNLLPEEKIKIRLAEFGILVQPQGTKIGASVTQYQFKLSAGVRLSSIQKHQADIALALGVKGNVQILPISGTSLVGVEVENDSRNSVKMPKSALKPGTLNIPIGVDVHGEHVSAPLNEMPHLLIAGSTGSGKSVLLHNIITALTKQMTPEEMQLVLIDPKRVELVAFARKPHLRGKVLYEYEDTVKMLMNLTDEMEKRYEILEKAGKREIGEYNASRKSAAKKMPYIVTVIDEFADFIIRSKLELKNRKAPSYTSRSKPWLQKMVTKYWPDENKLAIGIMKKDELISFLENRDAEDEMKRADANVELLIVRLAQMARAVGIHLIIATQRPSVDVITGLIKANFPTRIALTTASVADSNIILGVPGAEKLSGKGDLLFNDPSARGVQRLQAYYDQK